MKRIGLFLCIFLLLYAVGYGYGQETDALTLDSLIEEALDKNPRIRAAYSRWRAAEHKAGYSSGLPDPVAHYGYFGKNVETRVGPQEHKYGLTQKVPFPGKLSLKGKTQRKRAEMLKQKYEAVRREIIKEVKFVYYDLFWIDRAIRITEEEKAIMESLEKVAQRKYESNISPQQDVIKAHVELSKLIDKLFILKQNRESLEARMGRLLGRPEDAAFGPVAEIDISELEYSVDELHEIARDSRQELLAADLNIARARYERSLARLEYLPDFTFGVDYIQVGEGHTTAVNDGDDAWMGKVAVNIPIWFGKLGAQLDEKEAALDAARNNYENMEDSVAYEVEDLYFKITTYRDIVSLYKTALIPQTEQAFEAAKTAYETGRVDFLNWLDAERVLLQTRVAYYKAIADYQKSIAYLERVIGKNLGGEGDEE